MKRIFSFVLVAVVIAMLFAGCYSENKTVDIVNSEQIMSSDIGNTENISSENSVVSNNEIIEKDTAVSSVESEGSSNTSSTVSDISSDSDKIKNTSSEKSQSTVSTENSSREDEKVEDNNLKENEKELYHITYDKGGKRMYYAFDDSKPWYAADMESSDDLPRLTVDGKKMFYTVSSRLFYREVLSEKAAVKIGENVGWYMFEKYGAYAVYKTLDNVLYKSDLKKSTVIDRNIAFIAAVYDDGSGMLYAKSSAGKYDLYHFDGKETKKVMSAVTDNYVNKVTSTVYCIKNGDLFLLASDMTQKKIATDVKDVFCFYEEGLYYSTEQNGKKNLYFCNNDISMLLSANGNFVSSGVYSATVAFKSINDIDNGILFIALGDKKMELNVPNAVIDQSTIRFDMNGNAYFRVTEHDGTISLYKANIISEKIERYDTNISARSIMILQDGRVAYYKGGYENTKIADLYINKEKIAEKAYVGFVDYSPKQKTLIYITEWVDQEKGGKLWLYKNGEQPKKIAEKVSDCKSVNSEYIAYITDKIKGKGVLYIADFTGNSKKLDSDVSGIAYGQYGYGLD